MMVSRLAALPRTVWLIGLISLLNDAASDMIYPLVPLYLSAVLMAGPRVLGLIEGIAEATASLLKLFSGVIADRTGRTKPWVVGGYTLAGFARPLIALATLWPAVLALRFADRVGKGLRASPHDALLAASVTPAERGLAMKGLKSVVGEVPTHFEIKVGHPAEQLVVYAEARGIDHIVVGHRGHSLFERWLIGSEARRVIADAPCGVTVVRPRA